MTCYRPGSCKSASGTKPRQVRCCSVGSHRRGCQRLPPGKEGAEDSEASTLWFPSSHITGRGGDFLIQNSKFTFINAFVSERAEECSSIH